MSENRTIVRIDFGRNIMNLRVYSLNLTVVVKLIITYIYILYTIFFYNLNNSSRTLDGRVTIFLVSAIISVHILGIFGHVSFAK